MMIKIEKVDKQLDSMVASWRYPIQAYTLLGAMSVMFPVWRAPGILEEFLHSTILRPKKPLGSWNLVSPLLWIKEAWTDECAASLQRLVDQYNTPATLNFCNRKILRFNYLTTWSCSWDKNSSFKKKEFCIYNDK